MRGVGEPVPRVARRGDTRVALLEAAAGLLEGGGVGAVTLRAVGERAGVSRQAPYNHFADKGVLLSVLAANYLGRLGEAMAEAGRGAAAGPAGGVRPRAGCCAGSWRRVRWGGSGGRWPGRPGGRPRGRRRGSGR